MDPARRGLGACWVRHPTEWGGEENVVPPARNGQEARWTPHSGVLLMEAVVGGGRGRRVLMGLPRPEDGVLMMGI